MNSSEKPYVVEWKWRGIEPMSPLDGTELTLLRGMQTLLRSMKELNENLLSLVHALEAEREDEQGVDDSYMDGSPRA